MKSRYKAVFFDLDGTLVFTNKAYISKTVQSALRKIKNIKWTEEKAISFWFSHRRNDMLEEENIPITTFWDVFNSSDNHDERLKNVRVCNDIEFLKKLKDDGMKMGIITSCYSKVAEKEIDLVGRKYIEKYVIANNYDKISKPKPHPESAYRLMKSLNVKPEEIVMVGDGEEDILLAKNAGIYSILIDRNLNPVKSAVKPDKTINSLYELEDIIRHN
jgi:HAD superfamily hydrolase (TIGR01549 family)